MQPPGARPGRHPYPETRVTDISVERRETVDSAPPPQMNVREEDLEPHEGLRYLAKLFKVLAILLILLLLAEIVLGLVTEGVPAIPTLLVEATRLIVFAGLLWGLGDMALMLIESNHDLRATRILVGRLNGRVARLSEVMDPGSPAADSSSPLDSGSRAREPRGP
jgi:hypothetical protein